MTSELLIQSVLFAIQWYDFSLFEKLISFFITPFSYQLISFEESPYILFPDEVDLSEIVET